MHLPADDSIPFASPIDFNKHVREKAEQERAARERAERRQKERETILRRESALLLAQFDHLSMHGEPHERGYLLQDVLNRLFVAHGLPVAKSFQRNAGGEQIDGAFELEGWHYIVNASDYLAGHPWGSSRVLARSERRSSRADAIACPPELVINLKTAKALGIDVPPKVLAIADEVIE